MTGYRAVNFAVAALGLLLLGWMFTLVRHPDWAGEVTKLATLYLALQFSPLILFSLYTIVRRHKMLLLGSQAAKRTAVLRRRGLFDFVSPSAVSFALVSYCLFVAFAIYLDLHVYHNTSLSRSCYVAIASVTLVYALNAFLIYKYLYGRNNPLVSHEGRVHMIAGTVKVSVYGSIAAAWFISVFGTLGQPGLQDWRPFALIVFFVITTLLGFIGVAAPPRKSEAGGINESPASAP